MFVGSSHIVLRIYAFRFGLSYSYIHSVQGLTWEVAQQFHALLNTVDQVHWPGLIMQMSGSQNLTTIALLSTLSSGRMAIITICKPG